MSTPTVYKSLHEATDSIERCPRAGCSVCGSGHRHLHDAALRAIPRGAIKEFKAHLNSLPGERHRHFGSIRGSVGTAIISTLRTTKNSWWICANGSQPNNNLLPDRCLKPTFPTWPICKRRSND